MKWNIEDVVYGFKIKDFSHIEEVDADAYLMEHMKSGARLMYLDSADDNKVFSICFRTTPDNSKGVPHIMEHSTLCGSRKFPLKEPFIELAKGSLNTFLNAMTWPDKTMYPVASRNDADFHNLMDVYLDAVFYPNCLKDPGILMQEGWHYELDNKEGELIYNGVVYNEMKGVLSSPESLLENAAMEKLFPDTTYGVESGGDPEVIPSLSFREFSEFHRRFYHPSNSYIYLYGNMNIDETLSYIDKEYLQSFNRREVDSLIKTQRAFTVRKIAEASYGIAEGETLDKKAIHALFTAMTDHMTTKESLAFRILNYVLIDIDGAPLKKAILDKGLGNDVSGSYEDSYKQPVWMIELTGSEVQEQKKFSQIIDQTLRNLALEGIDQKMLDAALNRIEFIARENDYQGRPKGLFYGIRAMDLWLYDRNPMDALRYYDDMKELRQDLSKGYFENLLLKYVIKNPHQVLITMKAEKGLIERKNTETQKKLSAYKSSLSDDQLEQIIRETGDLKKRQAAIDSEENLKKIPLLKRTDLTRVIEDDVIEETFVKGIRHLHCDIDSNGISYVNLYFDVSGLSGEDLFYTKMLSRVLMSMDTKRYDYQELTRLSNAYTGGIGYEVGAIGKVDSDEDFTPFFMVKGKALTDKVKVMMDLIGETLVGTNFEDRNRLKEILLEEKAEWDLTAFDRGHVLSMIRLSSYFSKTGAFSDMIGLSYYYFLSNILSHFDEMAASVIEKLKELSDRIFTTTNLFIYTIGRNDEKQAVEKNIDALIMEMDKGTVLVNPNPVSVKKTANEAFLTSGKVQYVAKGGNFRQHGFAYTGAIRVMETILRYEYLWKQIRVLGGAYGAFVQFMRNGNALFCSYRDPNLTETLSAYQGIPEYLENLELSEREMTKYVIGTMAPEETSLTPFMRGERALNYYLGENTKESRMKIRSEIINCTINDIKALAPLVRSVIEEPYICVMGNEEKIRKNKKIFNAVLSMPK